jgi:hypothetical protein
MRSRAMRCILTGGGLLWAASRGLPARAQPLVPGLVLTTLEPCRIIDTRISGGPLVAGVSTTFNVVGTTLNSPTAQGGHAGGCGIPGFSGTTPQAQAVVINFIAVGASGRGDLVVWPSDQSQPVASVLNYAAQSALAGLNIANGIVMPLRQDAQGGDITVLAQISGTHLVADVIGYFTVPTAEYGYIYNLAPESILPETSTTFDSNGLVTPGITHVLGTATIVVNDPGVYKVTFSVSGLEPNQFAVAVNGTPLAGSVYGSGAGTQQNNGIVLVRLAATAAITLVNHTSASAVTLQTLAGGTQPNVNAFMLLEKLSP